MKNEFAEDVNPKANRSQLKELIGSINVLFNETNLPYLPISLCQDLVQLRSAARERLNKLNKGK